MGARTLIAATQGFTDVNKGKGRDRHGHHPLLR
jgi:hypothetical protein